MRRSRLALLIGYCSALVTTSVFAFEESTSAWAFDCATVDSNCYILDVRTPEEWRWVGHPGENKDGEGTVLEAPSEKVVNIAWKVQVGNALLVNPDFVEDVDEFFDGDTHVTLITMCRSGSRSRAAADALEAAGYANVYNMTSGFEGDRDEYGYRTVNGWKVEGFPYNDSAAGAYVLGDDDLDDED